MDRMNDDECTKICFPLVFILLLCAGPVLLGVGIHTIVGAQQTSDHRAEKVAAFNQALEHWENEGFDRFKGANFTIMFSDEGKYVELLPIEDNLPLKTYGSDIAKPSVKIVTHRMGGSWGHIRENRNDWVEKDDVYVDIFEWSNNTQQIRLGPIAPTTSITYATSGWKSKGILNPTVDLFSPGCDTNTACVHQRKGHFNRTGATIGECTEFKQLDHLCALMVPTGDGWTTNRTSPGCKLGLLDFVHYKHLTGVGGQPSRTIWDTAIAEVRSSEDPLVVGYRITDGTMQFGATYGQMVTLGIVSSICGGLLIFSTSRFCVAKVRGHFRARAFRRYEQLERQRNREWDHGGTIVELDRL